MRIAFALTVLALLRAPATSADQPADDAQRLRQAFLESMQALRALPDPPPLEEDVRRRQRVLDLVASLEVPPRVPAEVERHLARGVLAFREAKDRAGFLAAAAEFRQAVVLAPWHAPALLDLALVQEQLERYGEAAANLSFHAQVVGDAAKAANSRAKSAEFEARAEQQRAALDEYTSTRKLPLDGGLTKLFERPGGAESAAKLFERACDAGVAMGCFDSSYVHYAGLGVPKDLAKSAALGARACEAGVADGCAQAGLALAKSGGDPGEIANLAERGCSAGSSWACVSLATCYETGKGRERDGARALALYDQACRSGYQRGCALAGNVLAIGEVVAQDPARAVAYWKSSCEREGGQSCNYLGVVFRSGAKGVRKDSATAVSYFEKACALGDLEGCIDAGNMAFNGEGERIDEAKAAGFFELACEAGSTVGCFNLAICLEFGTGRAVDLERAAAHLRWACDEGYSEACDHLKILRKH